MVIIKQIPASSYVLKELTAITILVYALTIAFLRRQSSLGKTILIIFVWVFVLKDILQTTSPKNASSIVVLVPSLITQQIDAYFLVQLETQSVMVTSSKKNAYTFALTPYMLIKLLEHVYKNAQLLPIITSIMNQPTNVCRNVSIPFSDNCKVKTALTHAKTGSMETWQLKNVRHAKLNALHAKPICNALPALQDSTFTSSSVLALALHIRLSTSLTFNLRPALKDVFSPSLAWSQLVYANFHVQF